MKSAFETAKARAPVYGNSHKGYQINGRMLLNFFPEGLTLKTEADFSRFILFVMCSVKFCRYANNFAKGGHPDSIHDMGVYSFILEDYDEEVVKAKKPTRRAKRK